MMREYLEVLKQTPLFSGIGDEDLLRMLGCLRAKVEHFDKKYTVFAEGSPARLIGIVLSGEVHVVRDDYYGNRSLLNRVGTAELFAETFACAEVGALPVSVIAAEPSLIMLIDCGHILHTCERNCEFHRQMIFNLMKNLAVKNILFHRRAEIISKRSTREKLLTYLYLEAQRVGEARFSIPFDRQELADYLEVDRSGLSAEISKLRAEGILRSRKNHFELL